MKSRLLLISFIALVAIGCNSGNTPVETVTVESTQPVATAPPAPGAPPANMQEAIQSHPTMPDAAKKAVLGTR